MEGGAGGKVLRKKDFRCHSEMDLYGKSAMEGGAGGKVLHIECRTSRKPNVEKMEEAKKTKLPLRVR